MLEEGKFFLVNKITGVVNIRRKEWYEKNKQYLSKYRTATKAEEKTFLAQLEEQDFTSLIANPSENSTKVKKKKNKSVTPVKVEDIQTAAITEVDLDAPEPTA